MCHKDKLLPCHACENYATHSAPPPTFHPTFHLSPHPAHVCSRCAQWWRIKPISSAVPPAEDCIRIRVLWEALICGGPGTGESLSFFFPKAKQTWARSWEWLWEPTCFPPDSAPLAEPQAAVWLTCTTFFCLRRRQVHIAAPCDNALAQTSEERCSLVKQEFFANWLRYLGIWGWQQNLLSNFVSAFWHLVRSTVQKLLLFLVLNLNAACCWGMHVFPLWDNIMLSCNTRVINPLHCCNRRPFPK